LTSLPQLCVQLAQAERLPDMLAIFSRHGCKFSQSEIMCVLEAIPLESLAQHSS
ncbi:unnamed protein product, partial [Amoebophrya sp. A25]